MIDGYPFEGGAGYFAKRNRVMVFVDERNRRVMDGQQVGGFVGSGVSIL